MIRAEAVSRCRRATALVALLVWVASGPASRAVPVDGELLLLVDVTRSVSDDEFDALMGATAASFESAGVVDAIQSGTLGSLAVSLVFYSHRNMQTVGVDWMLISDANSAATFALAVENVERPFAQPRTGIAAAIDYGVPTFGDETGGPANGFESGTQGMLFLGGGVDDQAQRTNGSREQTVQDARDAALQSGVDVISALTTGDPGTVDAYFEQYVTGGQVGDYEGGVVNAADAGGLAATMPPALQGFLGSLAPEPEWPMTMAAAAVLLGFRRRRTNS